MTADMFGARNRERSVDEAAVDELTRKQKDLHEKDVLEMLVPALSKHLTAREGWKFLDTINPILYKSGSPWAYMIFGDGLAVVLAESLRRAGSAIRKAEEVHGSSVGWDEGTFKQQIASGGAKNPPQS